MSIRAPLHCAALPGGMSRHSVRRVAAVDRGRSSQLALGSQRTPEEWAARCHRLIVATRRLDILDNQLHRLDRLAVIASGRRPAPRRLCRGACGRLPPTLPRPSVGRGRSWRTRCLAV